MQKLDERKLRIIKTIIDDYILTAVPVGSRTISKISDLNLSSATIRNEMSDLEEMGYLDQPHTSAGRVPSNKAYRLYVNDLMKASALTQSEIEYIRSHFSKKITQVQDVITQTASVLSKLTNYASIIMAPKFEQVTIKHIQIVPISLGRALLVVVTSAGTVHDTLINVPKEYDALELSRISEMLTQKLQNGAIHEGVDFLKNELEQKMIMSKQFFNETLDTIQSELEQRKTYVVLEGATKLFMHPEYSDFNKTKEILSVLETKDMLYNILNQASKMEFTVTIGTENNIKQMQETSIVTATYKIGNMPVGSFGVIGPTRMDYSKVAAVLNCVCESLSEIFTNMQDEN